MRAAELTTDRQVLALRPAADKYDAPVAGAAGLTVRVYPSGAKQFVLRYRLAGGVRRRLVLGPYPALGLATARVRASEIRLALLAGSDPAGERLQARSNPAACETLDELSQLYWAAAKVGLHGGRRRPKRAVTIENEQQVWRRHIQEPLGSRRFAEVKRVEVKDFMRALVTANYAPATVATIGSVLHYVFAFAVLEEKLDINPVQGLARPLALTSRERMFGDEALATIWSWAEVASAPRRPDEKTAGVHARLDPAMGLALQLLMLTLTRRNEVAGARKAEIDRASRLWIIPSDRAKARHQHVVPLDDACLEIIEQAWSLDVDSPMLFPSPRVPGQHLDPHALTRAFARACARFELTLGSPHDVRRSGATTLTGRYGVSRHVVGLVLGHTPATGSAVTSVYDRHTYVPEKRHALELWSRHLRGLGAEGQALAGAEVLAETCNALNGRSERGGGTARTRAEALCAAGRLQEAVLGLTLDLAKRDGPPIPHLQILAQAGLEMAAAGSQSGVAAWISGFD